MGLRLGCGPRVTTKTGLAFKKRYFAEQWETTCKAAGIVDLHFHDIRGTTVTMLAEAGCTLPEIVAVTGHSLRRAQDILDKYLARTSKLAETAAPSSQRKQSPEQRAKGILTTAYLKDPTDPAWTGDSGLSQWSAFMDKYFPDGDRASSFTVYGYSAAQTLVQVLRQCGDDLSRQNVMKQATNLKDVEFPMLLPGITVNTSPSDYFPLKQMQMQRFNGTTFELFGPVLSGEGST